MKVLKVFSSYIGKYLMCFPVICTVINKIVHINLQPLFYLYRLFTSLAFCLIEDCEQSYSLFTFGRSRLLSSRILITLSICFACLNLITKTEKDIVLKNLGNKNLDHLFKKNSLNFRIHKQEN